METVGEQKLWTFLDRGQAVAIASCSAIRRSRGHPVKNYMDLAMKIAELQFMNRGLVLMFRGQKRHRRNRAGNSSLKQCLMRGTKDLALPTRDILSRRFDDLREAEERFVDVYRNAELRGRSNIERQQILRWSILQHYEVCATPLLDVTHSLRIAASFASDGAEKEAFVFVLGVPNISGAITASAEAGLQIVRLSSVCPPSARRPHIQEGYLLGEYPDMKGFDQKQLYEPFEIDFGLRLVAKFRFNVGTFWKDKAFPRISRDALYPNAKDPLFRLTEPIRRRFKGQI